MLLIQLTNYTYQDDKRKVMTLVSVKILRIKLFEEKSNVTNINYIKYK